MVNPLLDSLARAVEAQPGDVSLRLHLAGLLAGDGQAAEAIRHCAVVLQQDPGNAEAIQLLATAAGAGQAAPRIAPGEAPDPVARAGDEQSAVTAESPGAAPEAGVVASPTDGVSGAATEAASVAQDEEAGAREPGSFDWEWAAKQMADSSAPGLAEAMALAEETHPEAMWEIERAGVTLADVGGMESVKERLEVAFLAPMRNPELRMLYGKSLRGGLLLYGPPGCGKTFIARAIAGEMGAGFMNVTLSDILDQYIGNSESNLHEAFELARNNTPMVLFLDEVDAVGHKRTSGLSQSLRNVVNQLLQEMDGVGSNNEGVFVLAATNTPWDIDPALRRPGRLDRSVAVLPPDYPARLAILRHDLQRRPIEALDLNKLAKDTDGFTGADLTHLCESAAELALMDSVRTGRPRRITMKDLVTARKNLRPSAMPWFDAARNVVTYADTTGEYAELSDYMKRNGLL